MRNDHHRSARMALRWGLALFAVFQFGLAVAIELSWLIPRDPDYVQKAARLRQRLSCPERPAAVVMLGSSRTVFGLDGTSAENELLTAAKKVQPSFSPLPRYSGGEGRNSPVVVFNFGLWGAGPGTYLLSLQRLLAEGIRPDLVLVEVLPTFLNDIAGPYRDLGRLTANRLSRQEVDVLDSCGYAMANRRREWRLGWPFPSYSHRQSILNTLAPNLLPNHLRSEWSRNPDRSCFIPLKMSARDPGRQRTALFKAYEEYAYYLQCFHMGGPCPIALRRLLETCRSERIPTALVLMPEGSLFRSWYAPSTLQQVHAFLKELEREFGTSSIDAREWIEDGGFADSHHLQAWGARQFSRRLGREAIWPLLLGKPQPGTNSHAP